MRNSPVMPVDNIADSRLQQTDGSHHPLLIQRLGRIALALTITAMLGANSGCQYFCRGTNGWSRVVDRAADHRVRFDRLYFPRLDLTRIGRPGGLHGRCCACPVHCCSSDKVYAHRWNAPRPVETSTAEGLEGVPDFPDVEPGPYFPPSDEPAPLFGPMTQSRAFPSRDAGIVRTQYTRVSTAAPPHPERVEPSAIRRYELEPADRPSRIEPAVYQAETRSVPQAAAAEFPFGVMPTNAIFGN